MLGVGAVAAAAPVVAQAVEAVGEISRKPVVIGEPLSTGYAVPPGVVMDSDFFSVTCCSFYPSPRAFDSAPFYDHDEESDD